MTRAESRGRWPPVGQQLVNVHRAGRQPSLGTGSQHLQGHTWEIRPSGRRRIFSDFTQAQQGLREEQVAGCAGVAAGPPHPPQPLCSLMPSSRPATCWFHTQKQSTVQQDSSDEPRHREACRKPSLRYPSHLPQSTSSRLRGLLLQEALRNLGCPLWPHSLC